LKHSVVDRMTRCGDMAIRIYARWRPAAILDSIESEIAPFDPLTPKPSLTVSITAMVTNNRQPEIVCRLLAVDFFARGNFRNTVTFHPEIPTSSPDGHQTR